ncbi:phage tail tape measure protein [Chitiniphilus eburneus]|uniref:Phage tail tape measure protein n=1 Tax=Chitiniphilus eburneus TaxID=2571148 RepID=A0A4U0QDT8_9NEIS|nr:phage tail tape measure protein [Chitiniphilus eburneus]TJZ78792.1 phage tail tape measure protein [Chitiniphilus eburneus]
MAMQYILGIIGEKAVEAVAESAIKGLQNVAKAPLEAAHRYTATRDELGYIAGQAGIQKKGLESTVASWNAQLIGMSQRTNQYQEELLNGFKSTVESNVKPDAALGLTEAAGRAATATNNDLAPLSKAVTRAHLDFGVRSEDADNFFEIIAASGRSGTLNFNQLLQKIPSLITSAKNSTLGLRGTSGISSVTAALQIAAKDNADPEQAHANLNGFLNEFNSGGIAHKFQKLGVGNFEQEKKNAIASGDPLLYMAKLADTVTGGDATKLGQLFSSREARDFQQALVANQTEYQKIHNEASSSKGLIHQRKLIADNSDAGVAKSLRIKNEASLQNSGVTQGYVNGLHKTANFLKDYTGPNADAFRFGFDQLGLLKPRENQNGSLSGLDDGNHGDAIPVVVVNWPNGTPAEEELGPVDTIVGLGLTAAHFAPLLTDIAFPAKGLFRQAKWLFNQAVENGPKLEAPPSEGPYYHYPNHGQQENRASDYPISAQANQYANRRRLKPGLSVNPYHHYSNYGQQESRIYDYPAVTQAKGYPKKININRPLDPPYASGPNKSQHYQYFINPGFENSPATYPLVPSNRRQDISPNTLSPGALGPQKVSGTVEVKVSMPPYLTGQTSVTQPAGAGVKLQATAAKTGNYHQGGF